MVNRVVGKPNQNSDLIPKCWVDERHLSAEKLDGSAPILIAGCGKRNPVLWTYDYKEVSCAECNVAILGYENEDENGDEV